ncbi:hypothetical protein BHE74_00025806 [Ensete ventricosum]|nr:hypothetical protein GW17_00050607 [Ensete ventricosum]RWW66813.1 hypothetical protein BHE74_00025806 [Ensete ventricosum]RZR96063.1 hypothetical protein BHM03_00025013 [Ensete ventricosum]
MGSRTGFVLQKNTIINFTQSQVLIGFLCIVSEFQNTGHSQCINPWEIIRARFREK